MRILVILVLSFATHAVLAQSDPVRVRQARIKDSLVTTIHRDSMVTAIQTGAGLSRTIADSTYAIISGYGAKIRAVVKSRIPKEQKDQQTKSLAAERDEKIRQLLTEDQITRLKTVYSKNKPAAPSH